MACTTPQLSSQIVGLLQSFESACAVSTAEYVNDFRRSRGVIAPPPRTAAGHVVPRNSTVFGSQLVEPATPFHSAAVPAISLSETVQQVGRGVFLELGTVEAAVVLCHRYAARTGLPVTQLMMHRLLVAAVLVAAKAMQDEWPTTAHVARASGLQVAELTRLEALLLRGIDWRAVVTEDDVDRVAVALAALASCGGGGSVGLAAASASTDSEDAAMWVASPTHRSPCDTALDSMFA